MLTLCAFLLIKSLAYMYIFCFASLDKRYSSIAFYVYL